MKMDDNIKTGITEEVYETENRVEVSLSLSCQMFIGL